ncbi:hypothetical protein [Pseudomonas coronafaciens]|uniref:hypothetical protein n=1 Tax=Pseudomonas coronafaciens TaxID=53409 RepID=UPI0006D5EA1A|nr:hypothetical protein [Pseudomonas coronafaciens]KPZ27226.1 Uncharacterized protein ALO38_03707 [Pseudomonas coronafaciens pv. zizaniae]
MTVLPIPLFEAHERFKKLNPQALDVELSDIRAFLANQNNGTGAIQSYLAVRLFLSRYVKLASYQAQRNNIEKLLSWSICIARKPITALCPDDLEEFFEFCSSPPQAWISLRPEKRFTKANDRKRHSQTTYVINSHWRPFVSNLEVQNLSTDGLPECESKGHQYAVVSVNLLAMTCRSFFLFLATEDLIRENPMREINRSERYVRPRDDYKRQTVFSASEWGYLNRALDRLVTQDRSHERTRFIVMSIYHLHLRASDFASCSRTLKMSDFFSDVDGAAWLPLGASRDERQIISVGDEYLSIHLPRYRRYLGVDSQLLSRDPTPLFASHRGRAGLAARYVNVLFQEVLDVAASIMVEDGRPED